MRSKNVNQRTVFQLFLYVLAIFDLAYLAKALIFSDSMAENIYMLLISFFVLIVCVLILYLINYGKIQRHTREIELLDDSYNKTIILLKEKGIEIHELSEIFINYCKVISRK